MGIYNTIRLTSFAVIASAWFLPGIAAAGKSGEGIPIDVLIPAYFYPGVDGNGNGQDDWKDMAEAADHVGITAIMNPHNGSFGNWLYIHQHVVGLNS